MAKSFTASSITFKSKKINEALYNPSWHTSAVHCLGTEKLHSALLRAVAESKGIVL